MKTYELANALELLARILRDGPNEDTQSLTSSKLRRPKPDSASLPVALSTLVALSGVDKQQWQALIREYEFPIEIRPRDASRDVLGKVLNYLEENPIARKKLQSAPATSRSTISPELMSALQHLLK